VEVQRAVAVAGQRGRAGVCTSGRRYAGAGPAKGFGPVRLVGLGPVSISLFVFNLNVLFKLNTT